MPVLHGLRGSLVPSNYSMLPTVDPQVPLSLGWSNVRYHDQFFSGWKHGEQPEVQSIITVLSLITAPMRE